MTENSRLYLITGSVVDEQGNPLEDVSLDITVHKLRITPKSDEFASSVQYREMAHKTFKISKRGTGLTVMFRKDGYYPQVHHFDTSAYGAPDGDHRFEQLTVVMEKQGLLTGLRKLTGTMGYRLPGRGEVVDFDLKNNPPFRWIDNVHALAHLPPNCLYLVADQDSQGHIAAFEPVPGKAIRCAKRVRLMVNAADGGFAEVTLDGETPPFHLMRQAPETGYVDELVLGEARAGAGHRSGTVSFYFRSNGRYGKATITAMPVLRSDDSVHAVIHYVLQPNGTRHLESEDHVRRFQHGKKR
jgi:hypothetical protein